ncbi:sushi, von Willebrand factor type A, EGF and pentraxin domain-containing protein 1-like [Mercenaria mercenaria]|uniref:sushi, von Willebrand factor type A, EGF and pentraxin domain-containing protein 1-like n=1 Tax=Mercenaria mercenaria TaxID=6596 RepID=UPI00234F1A2E|nr:sushi, von Willebrand factor type A, EGF and pentraxin domain-containing protein 1-like [Mercenaria mercenaria]
MATVSCDYGYQPNLAFIHCITSGEWENATCEPKDCGSLSAIADGTFTSPVTTHGAKATYTCNVGHVLTGGDSTRFCDAGIWNGTVPICTPIVFQNCSNVKLCNPSYSDGEYCIYPEAMGGHKIKVFCYGMSTASPSEYIICETSYDLSPLFNNHH